MRRLLKIGCATVIILLALAVIATVFKPNTNQTAPQQQVAIEDTVPPESTSTPGPPTPTTIPAAVPLAYDVASEEIINAPNGRTRIRQEIVIPESGPPEAIAATLADAVRKGFACHSNAIVSGVFGYGPDDDIGSGFTQGRASASRDGKGLDAGSAQLLAGLDTGQIQIEVATDWYQGLPTETEMVNLPLGAP